MNILAIGSIGAHIYNQMRRHIVFPPINKVMLSTFGNQPFKAACGELTGSTIRKLVVATSSGKTDKGLGLSIEP